MKNLLLYNKLADVFIFCKNRSLSDNNKRVQTFLLQNFSKIAAKFEL